MEVSSHEDSAGEFCCVGSIFSMKLLGFVSKAIKLLLTELVGQCRNILSLAFSALTSLRSVNTGKGCGQYIPSLTSHSVNKSIKLLFFFDDASDFCRLSVFLKL